MTVTPPPLQQRISPEGRALRWAQLDATFALRYGRAASPHWEPKTVPASRPEADPTYARQLSDYAAAVLGATLDPWQVHVGIVAHRLAEEGIRRASSPRREYLQVRELVGEILRKATPHDKLALRSQRA